MYKHKKTQRHHFKKDCCRVIKVKTNVLESMGFKRQNTDNSNIDRDCEKTKGKVIKTQYAKYFGDKYQIPTTLKDKSAMIQSSFGQSTSVIVLGDASSNKSKSFQYKDEDKENMNASKPQANLSQTQAQPQVTDLNQAIPQIMQMLFEIKTQNLYLMERNLELESIINGEVRPTIEDGFYEIKSEIRELKKLSKNQDQQFKRLRFTKSTKKVQNMNARKYQTTQQLSYEEQEEKLELSNQDQRQIPSAATLQNNLQSATGAESTFMRKFEETVQIPKYEQQQNSDNDSMRFSVGANLLELMMKGGNTQNNNSGTDKKQGPQKKSGRRVRNFNFRCNLNEIDKIIEEDYNEEVNPTNETSNYSYSNNASPINKMEQINKEIRQIQQQEMFEQTAPINLNKYQSEEKNNKAGNESDRPQTGANKIAQQRKGWGVANNRPKTGANAPLRIGKGMINRVQSSENTQQNDNILALLSQESEEKKHESQFESKTEIIENTNHLSNGSDTKQDAEMKLEELKDTAQKQEIQMKPKIPMQRKRGMFKAPPTDLLEQLLLDDSNIQETPQQAQTERTPVKILESQIQATCTNNIKMNNFMTEQPKSRSRSRKRLIQNNSGSNKKVNFIKPLGQNLIAGKFNLKMLDSDCEEETKGQEGISKQGINEDDDNPFQSTSTLLELQNKNEKANQSKATADNKKKRMLFKKPVQSIEDLLRGEILQDQDQDEDTQFTQTEKEGVFFLNQGKKVNSSDNTAEFNNL
eukprot:403330796